MVRRQDWAWGCWLTLAVPLVFLLLGPPAILALRSIPFLGSLSGETALAAMKLSLWTTAVSLVVILVFGTPAAYFLANSRSWLAKMLNALADLPIVLPPAVAGIALLLLFGRTGPVGAFLEDHGISVAFSAWAVVIAQTFVSAPLYLRSTAVALRAIEPEILQNAQLDGATPGAVFRQITVPIARHGIITGAVLAWARALGEFGATILFAGNLEGKTQTLPLAIYTGFESDLGSAEAMSAVLLAIAFIVLIAVKLASKD